MIRKRKAFAYITNKSNKLLLFTQPDSPEAGIQVPAGTIEVAETPLDGVLREAYEETNLEGLKVCCFLGEQIRDMSDYDKQEIHHRYFYHLLCESETPETWSHGEYSPSDEPNHDRTLRHRFDFYWADLAEMPKLIAEHDYFLGDLLKKLNNG